MTVLVTGATGFIGSHLVNQLKKTDRVVALERDHLRDKWLLEALEGCVTVRGDIRDTRLLKRVLADYEVDKVYHLASQAIVRHAYYNPTETFDANVMGTVAVLDACRLLGVEKVLVMSTDKVYGDQTDAQVWSHFRISEPYGTSKICADLIAQTFAKVYGMKVVIPRSCNAYGYDPYNDRIIPNTIRACIRGKDPIIYKEDPSARQYIYVEDLAGALILLMNSYEGIHNIASRDVETQEEVVLEVLKHFPERKPVYIERGRTPEIWRQSMKVVNWLEPKTSFEEGIKLTVERFKEYGC